MYNCRWVQISICFYNFRCLFVCEQRGAFLLWSRHLFFVGTLEKINLYTLYQRPLHIRTLLRVTPGRTVPCNRSKHRPTQLAQQASFAVVERKVKRKKKVVENVVSSTLELSPPLPHHRICLTQHAFITPPLHTLNKTYLYSDKIILEYLLFLTFIIL